MRQFAFVAAAALTALLPFPYRYSAQSGISIEGIVLEATTDRPLQGVNVSAVSGELKRAATTDSQGHFLLGVPGPGRYLLTPSLEGMVHARLGSLSQPHEPGSWINVSSGEQITDISLRMQRAGVISGRALDSNGNPFSGGRGSVRVLRYFYDAYGKRQLESDSWVHFDRDTNNVARMDDHGDYRLYGLQPGDYYVQVGGSAGYYFYPGTLDESLAVSVHVRSGEEVRLATIVLPMLGKTPVRFHISESTGKPIKISGSRAFNLTSSNGISFSWGTFQLGANPPETSAVQSTSLSPGSYDFTVGLMGLGSNPEMYYGHIALNVGTAELDQSLSLSSGIRISGGILTEDANGKPANIAGLRCKLHSDSLYVESAGASGTSGCLGSQFSPGLYQLEVTGMPPDAYVESAIAKGIDILAGGLQLDTDTEIQVRIRTLGGTLDGIVKDSDDKPLSDAIVALVPDEPLRGAGTFYRFSTSDVHGKYQLRGIAPGSYRLFAWTELDGAAYRNAEFMKVYYEKGTPVTIDSFEHPSLNIWALNQENLQR